MIVCQRILFSAAMRLTSLGAITLKSPEELCWALSQDFKKYACQQEIEKLGKQIFGSPITNVNFC